MEVSLVVRLLIIAWIAKASKTSCTCHVYVCVTWLIYMRDSHMRYSHSRTDIDVHIYTATGTDTNSDRKCESDGGWLRLAFSIKSYMSNMNESVVLHFAHIRTDMSDTTHSCVWYDSFMCMLWPIHTCITIMFLICGAWLNHKVWHTSFSWVTCLIYMRAMTHPHVRQALFTYMPWLIHMCDVSDSYAWHGRITQSNTQPIYMRNLTHLYAWCDVSYVSHDSFISLKYLWWRYFGDVNEL